MSIILRELAVKLGLEVDAASFAEGQLAADALELGLKKLVEWGKEAVHWLYELAHGTMEYAHDTEVTAQQIGLTTEALQQLRYAGTLVGVSAEGMTNGIRLLSRHMAEAAAGSKASAEAFGKIGVKVKDATGHLRPADDVMEDLADHFKSIPDGAEKTALAMKLFGRAGAQMVPLLNQGSAGIADLRKEAEDLGVVMTEEAIKQGAELAHNVDRLSAVWDGVKRALGGAVIPQLLEISQAIVGWVKANRELIKQRIASVVAGIAKAFHVLIEAGKVLVNNIDVIVRTLIGMAVVWALVNAAAVGAAVATAVAWLAALAPFLAIAAIIAGILLVLDDIKHYKAGDKKSLFGLWAKTLEGWLKPNDNDPWWLAAIKSFVTFLGVAYDKMQELEKLVTANFGKISKVLSYLPPVLLARLAVDMGGKVGDVMGGAAQAKADLGYDLNNLSAPSTRERGLVYNSNPVPGLMSSQAAQPNYSYPQQSLAPRSVVVQSAPVVNITAGPNMSVPELQSMVRQELQTHSDAIHENAAAALSE